MTEVDEEETSTLGLLALIITIMTGGSNVTIQLIRKTKCL